MDIVRFTAGSSPEARAGLSDGEAVTELALVLNSRAEICGYTVCNDVSSRTIEGENPLYLPQAKMYLGSCALGPVIRPAWEVPDPYRLEIRLTISLADGDVVRIGIEGIGVLANPVVRGRPGQAAQD